jgi:hypothetical protein
MKSIFKFFRLNNLLKTDYLTFYSGEIEGPNTSSVNDDDENEFNEKLSKLPQNTKQKIRDLEIYIQNDETKKAKSLYSELEKDENASTFLDFIKSLFK